MCPWLFFGFGVEVGAKQAEKGRLLQVGNLMESGSRSKVSGKVKIASRRLRRIMSGGNSLKCL